MNAEDLFQYKIKLASLSGQEQRERNAELGKYARGELLGPPVGYPSIDKPWLRYYSFTPEDLVLPHESIYQYIRNRNKDNMDAVAIELRTSANDFGPGYKITYREFFQKVEKAAAAFKQLQVQPNEIVGLILPNLPESRILIYALSMIGATAYPMNFMLPAKNVESIIRDNAIKKFVIFGGFFDKYKYVFQNTPIDTVIYLDGKESLPIALRTAVRIIGKSKIPEESKVISYSKFLQKAKKEIIEPYYEMDHIAVIVGTSGTTGIPKGVCLSDDGLNSSALQDQFLESFYCRDTFLDVLIQSIGYGVMAMHVQLSMGMHGIVIPELVMDKIAKLLVKIQPDCFSGGPVHCINIARSQEFQDGKVKPMKTFLCGGASLSKTLEMTLNKVEEGYCENGTINGDIFVRQGLGATESGGCGTFAKHGSYKFGSVGIPLVLVTFAVFELGTEKELGYNELGELCISAPNIMRYYLNNPEETDKVLKRHSDGTYWLHLADIGYIAEDGNVFHVDRAKNIFMRTGFNIHPQKITEYLKTLPMIENCVVAGVPHPDEQMVPVAFVVVEDTYKEMPYEQLVKQLYEQCFRDIDELYIPHDWYIVDKLPMNLGGKVDSNLLLQRANIDYTVEEKSPDMKYISFNQ